MAKIGAWLKAKTGGVSEDPVFDGRWIATDGKVMTISGDRVHGTSGMFASITSKNADGILLKTAGAAGKLYAATLGEDGSFVWTDGDVWRREEGLAQSAPPAGGEPASGAAAQVLAGSAPDVGRAGWLAAEALRLEAQAKESDRSGRSAEAILAYKRAAAKLAAAAECCPAGHADRLAMTEHGQDLTMRAIYLESLGGRVATEPLESLLPEDEGLASRLSLDLSAPAPCDQHVASLVASAGVSGATASLSDEGLQLVAALGSGDEMRAFVRRVLGHEGLELHVGSEPQYEFYTFTEGAAAGSGPLKHLAQLQAELTTADWVRDPAAEARAEVDAAEAEKRRAAEEARAAEERARLEQTAAAAAEAAAAARKELEKDKLNLAIALEKESKELEAQGKKPEALLKLITCSHAFKYVYDHDPRAKASDKVKEMVRQRLENVVAECTRLKLEGVVASQ